MNTELIEKIQKFFDLFDEIIKEKDEALNKVSAYDKKLSSIYHQIEGMQFGHIAESHKLLKELQILLSERRSAKGNVRLLQTFYDMLKVKMDKCKKSINETIAQLEF